MVYEKSGGCALALRHASVSSLCSGHLALARFIALRLVQVERAAVALCRLSFDVSYQVRGPRSSSRRVRSFPRSCAACAPLALRFYTSSSVRSCLRCSLCSSRCVVVHAVDSCRARHLSRGDKVLATDRCVAFAHHRVASCQGFKVCGQMPGARPPSPCVRSSLNVCCQMRAPLRAPVVSSRLVKFECLR